MNRSSGILCAISSLPSRFGIGTLGREAYRFADFLEEAGQHCWQVLPVGPTSMGDSPYQSFSSFAGNPYFIDLDLLAEEGLISPALPEGMFWGSRPGVVDYGTLYENRYIVLQAASDRAWQIMPEKLAAFAADHADWLPDYCLYMALKRHFDMKCWIDWPDAEARSHNPKALERYQKELDADIRLFTFIQFAFYRQWDALRLYCNEKGIRLFGDIPIYVALDSADVWANPEQFQLDDQQLPKVVSGCPPDYFSATGQLWGNPIYNWDAMEKDGWKWWKARMGGASALFDTVRIDHFRGLASYWAIPYGDKTAVNGKWVKGPGLPFVQALQEAYPDTEIIAEDLGALTQDVLDLLADSGLPGMKVLQFAFSGDRMNMYLPHCYPRNCVCYLGTHDNTTTPDWEQHEASAAELKFARAYCGPASQYGLCYDLILLGLRSPADLFIATMQDLLGLGASARMNLPGSSGSNWQWRMLPGQIPSTLAADLKQICELFGRCEQTGPVGRAAPAPARKEK